MGLDEWRKSFLWRSQKVEKKCFHFYEVPKDGATTLSLDGTLHNDRPLDENQHHSTHHNNTQQKNIQHNNSQHNNIQHKKEHSV
jgi:hypothetical protein